MRRLDFAPEAEDDLHEIAALIARDNPARARTFVAELEERCGDLLSFPDTGRERTELAPDLRSKPHGRHVIYDSPGTEVVRIERILHGARDAGAVFGDG